MILDNKSPFYFQAIRNLSHTPMGGADIGECLETIKHIEDGNDKSWYQNWYNLAERLSDEANQMLKNNHHFSARNMLMRASNYYRSSEFFIHNKENLPLALEAYDKSLKTFSEALKYFPEKVETLSIPFENIQLHGYFIPAKSTPEKRPLIIFQTGFDGTAEELLFLAYQACIERNYNCLIFEGPGQGSVLRHYNAPFRYNWETVVTPALNFILENKKEIDEQRMALIGISMGGYLVPRALAFEPRIKLGIANGGVLSFYETALHGDKELDTALKQEEGYPELNRSILEGVKNYCLGRWFFNHGMYAFQKDDPISLLLETKKYDLTSVIDNIKTKMLVFESEGDSLIKGQSKKFYDALKTEKTLLEFKNSEGAGLHCQAGALLLSRDRMFNWIDENI